MEQLIDYGQLDLSEYTLALKNRMLMLPPPLYTPSTNGKHRDFLLVVRHNISTGAKV